MKNPFDSRQLLAFVTLARTGSFTRTGRELFLTQSAISHSIRALERDAGCRLITRVAKKVLPTPAGEYLLHHAEKALGELVEAREALARMKEWANERLRLGASAAVCQYILPEVLRRFTEFFPRSNLAVFPADTSQALRMFEQNRIDAAFCIEPKTEPSLVFEPLFWDELVFLVGARHPWAAEGRAARPELGGQNVILYARNSYTFRLVREYFGEDEIELKSGLEMGNIEAMKELVKIGVGIAILPKWVARRELKEGTVAAVPLGKRKLKRHWGILRRPRAEGAGMRKFIALCQEAVRQLEMPEAMGESSWASENAGRISE